MNSTANLKNTIEAIVAKGSAIVSFEYKGKKRNGVIGYTPFGVRVWGEHTSKAIVTAKNGEEFVTVKTNNEDTPDGHAFKSFKLSEISCFTYKGVTL